MASCYPHFNLKQILKRYQHLSAIIQHPYYQHVKNTKLEFAIHARRILRYQNILKLHNIPFKPLSNQQAVENIENQRLEVINHDRGVDVTFNTPCINPINWAYWILRGDAYRLGYKGIPLRHSFWEVKKQQYIQFQKSLNCFPRNQ